MRFVTFCILLLSAPAAVSAVPPPDIVIGIASQAVQFLSFAAVVFIGAFFSIVRFVGGLWRWRALRILGVVAVVLVLGGGTFYGMRLHNATKVESTLRAADVRNSAQHKTVPRVASPPASGTTVPAETVPDTTTSAADDAVGDAAHYVSHVAPHTDARFRLMEDFYRAIAEGRLDDAYAVFVPTVPRAVFDARFRDVTRVIVYRLWAITDIYSGGDVVLCTRELCVRYDVRAFLNINADGVVHNISAYTVYVRDSFAPSDAERVHTQPAMAPRAVSNAQLRAVLSQQPQDAFVVLDAREDAEYKNGTLPGSTHIRPADIRAGAWRTLPRNTPIYVMCWSGIRGKEVATFLRGKGLAADYLAHGAKGWVDAGGVWKGGISFVKKYSAKRYSYVLSVRELQKEIANGALVVDTRELERFDAYHIPYSTNISLFALPRRDRVLVLAQLPARRRVVTTCDGYVNCFDARITGVALEEEGHTFVGRFAPVTDYKKVQ